ncbi:hypothetical protein D3C75_580600 [compost metagenome]
MDLNAAGQRNICGYGRRNPLSFLSGQAVVEKHSAGSAAVKHHTYLCGNQRLHIPFFGGAEQTACNDLHSGSFGCGADLYGLLPSSDA